MPDKNSNILYISTVFQLSSLLKKIKDLTTINQRVVVRIDQKNILLFSFVGDSFKNIHAFKNYVFPTEEIMTIKKGDLDEPIFFIAKDGRKLYKTLENLLDYKDDIKCKISINDENYINYIGFNNSKLDIKILGNDPISIGSQIGVEDVDNLMDVSNSIFNFRLNKLDFSKIKKMGAIDNEPKSVLYMNLHNNLLSLGETKWHLNVSEIDYENITLSFPKAYFNTINPTDFIDIYVFEEFILCKYDDYNLMIILETSI